MKSNLSFFEWIALKQLKKSNSNIIIIKAVKGKCTAVMNKKDYDEKLEKQLNDKQTHKQLKRDSIRLNETQLNKFIL